VLVRGWAALGVGFRSTYFSFFFAAEKRGPLFPYPSAASPAYHVVCRNNVLNNCRNTSRGVLNNLRLAENSHNSRRLPRRSFPSAQHDPAAS
jgi:hypothetical protein